MKRLMFFAVVCLTALITVSFFSCSTKAPRASLKTDVDSLSYAIGIQYSQGLEMFFENQGYEGNALEEFYKGFVKGSNVNTKNKKANAHLDGMAIGKQIVDIYGNINKNLFGSDSTTALSLNKENFLAGFLDAAQNKNLHMDKNMAQGYAQVKSEEIQERANEGLKVENLAFLENNKTKAGVIALPNGLQYKVEKEGAGPKPVEGDMVKVNYRGTNINGVEFDSGDGAIFPLQSGLGGVIQGWAEGVQLMPVGSKYIFYTPYDLGYGERGQPPVIKPYATLIFEIELLEIVKQ